MKHVEPISFVPYPRLFKTHEEEYMDIIRDVLSRGAYIMQNDLEEFEAGLADYIGVKHAIGVADCTNGLLAGLLAAEVGVGDEVIFPSHTFVATAGAIKLAGATPVPCDIRPKDGLMNPSDIERHITKQTRAIMPVQLNGRICEMDEISAVAHKHGLQIFEDSAQALGATYKGQQAGTFGDFGAFSFYPAKTLGCFGDGGALITNDDHIADTVKSFRDHGRSTTADPVLWGGNCRLDNLQAAVLNFQLARYPQTIERRREIARRYRDALQEIDDLQLPPGPDGDQDNFDIFQNYELQAGRRDKLRNFLSERKIASMIQWGGKAVHQFAALGFDVELPSTEDFFKRCMLLPLNSYMTNAEVDRICDAVREFYGT